MIENKFRTFNHELNQGDRKETLYQCTLYSMAMNVYYNCGIKITEDDLDIIAKEQYEAGLLSFTKGGKGQDGANAILRYIMKNSKIRGWKVPTLIQTPDDKEVKKYMSFKYMVTTGITVNKKFVDDILDGKIDTKEYKDLKGNELKHYLNMIEDFQEKGFDMSFVDNYFLNSKGRPNLYSGILKEVLEDIDQNLKYIFILPEYA